MRKKKDFGMKIMTVFTFTIVTSMLTLAIGDNGSEVSEAERAEESRIYALLDCLSKAINEPNEFNAYMIAAPCALDSKANLMQKIEYFSKTRSSFAENYPFKIHEEIWFAPRDIKRINAQYQATMDVYIRANNQVRRKDAGLTLSINQFSISIINPSALLDSINSIIDNFRGEISPGLENDGYPDFIGTESAPHESVRLLKSKIFFAGGEYYIPRFTITASKSHFKSQIYGRPFDMSAIKWYDDISGNLDLFICTDPNWNRVIGSDALSNRWLVFGSSGSGIYNFNHPYGIANLGYESIIIADGYNKRAVAYELNYLYQPDTIIPESIGIIQGDYGMVYDVARGYIPQGSSFQSEIAVLDLDGSKVDVYDVGGRYNFTKRATLLSFGTGYRKVDRPTSVCYARDPAPNYCTPYIYVTDAENNRVILVGTQYPIHIPFIPPITNSHRTLF
jgi:hypothetical protein